MVSPELPELPYSYDGFNRRFRTIAYAGAVGQEYEASDVRYLYDGWRSIQEVNLNDSNKLLARYVYGLTYLDELIHMDRDADGDGDPYDDDSSSTAESYNAYYVQDHIYSVIALVLDDVGEDTSSDDGTVVERYWYEPYGKATLTSADGSTARTTSSYGNVHLFTGQRWAEETKTVTSGAITNFGLYYYKNRYYDPGLGRFVSRDRHSSGSLLNRYEYCESNPQRDLDPFGWWTKEGVLKFLCQTEQGRKIVADVLPKLTVGSYTEIKFFYQAYEDKEKKKRKGRSTKLTAEQVPSYIDWEQGKLDVWFKLDEGPAAARFIHEGTHGLQCIRRGEPVGPPPPLPSNGDGSDTYVEDEPEGVKQAEQPEQPGQGSGQNPIEDEVEAELAAAAFNKQVFGTDYSKDAVEKKIRDAYGGNYYTAILLEIENWKEVPKPWECPKKETK